MNTHRKTQVARLIRVGALAFAASGLVDQLLGSGWLRTMIGAAGVGAAETIWRQIKPAPLTKPVG